jgi:ABC-type multidrug transport system ATPase subunit
VLTDGERTLVALAHALVREPRLLIADDPTANLNVLQREDVTGLLRRAANEEGLGVLITVPDMPQMAYADRVGSLSEGRLLLSGSRDQADVIDFPGKKQSA